MTKVKDLENVLQEFRQKSTPELVSMLGYHPPQFAEEIKSDLLKFFSNLDLPVFTMSLSDILSGTIITRHSRTSEDVRTVVAEQHKKDEKFRECFSKLNIPDVVNIIGRSYYSRVLGEYGDDSAAQVIPIAVGFENVSLLQAMNLLHHRLLAGIEKSTRYKRYDKKEDGRYSYFTDPKFEQAGLKQEFESLMNNLFDTYSALCNTQEGTGKKFYEHLTTKTLPFELFRQKVNEACGKKGWQLPTDEELNVAYKKTMTSMHLDNVRHLLPLSAKTMLALQLNAQTAKDIIIRGMVTPTTESAVVTEIFRREMQNCIEPVIRDLNIAYADADPQRQQEIRERALDYYNFHNRDISTKNIMLFAPVNELLSVEKQSSAEFGIETYRTHVRIVDRQYGFVVEIATKDTINDLVAAIIKENDATITHASACETAKRMHGEAKENLVLNYAGLLDNSRKNRRHKPGRAFERVMFDISLKLPIGEIRDLRRHRILTNLEPLNYSPTLGYFISPHIEEAGLAKHVEETYSKTSLFFEKAAEAVNSTIASYALPLATWSHLNLFVNLRELFHIIELRTQPGAHINYKRICRMIYQGVHQLIPIAAAGMKFVDYSTETDYGRALQEIRSQRKNV